MYFHSIKVASWAFLRLSNHIRPMKFVAFSFTSSFLYNSSLIAYNQKHFLKLLEVGLNVKVVYKYQLVWGYNSSLRLVRHFRIKEYKLLSERGRFTYLLLTSSSNQIKSEKGTIGVFIILSIFIAWNCNMLQGHVI